MSTYRLVNTFNLTFRRATSPRKYLIMIKVIHFQNISVNTLEVCSVVVFLVFPFFRSVGDQTIVLPFTSSPCSEVCLLCSSLVKINCFANIPYIAQISHTTSHNVSWPSLFQLWTREYVLTREQRDQNLPAHEIMHLDLADGISQSPPWHSSLSWWGWIFKYISLDSIISQLRWWLNTRHKLNFTSESDKMMKGCAWPQHTALPIIACKNLAFNQRRCVESVGNLVWALTRTANYSKQGKFVSPVWEDAVRVQSKVRTLNHNLFCSQAERVFPINV